MTSPLSRTYGSEPVIAMTSKTEREDRSTEEDTLQPVVQRSYKFVEVPLQVQLSLTPEGGRRSR